jgi:hypothetical protein
MRAYVWQVTLVAIAMNIVVRWAFVGDLQGWQVWIAWLGLTAIPALVLARWQRLSLETAIWGYVAAVFLAYVAVAAVIVIGFMVAINVVGG